MSELLVDFITSLDGHASGKGWPGFWGLEGPEYLAWLSKQPKATYLMKIPRHSAGDRCRSRGRRRFHRGASPGVCSATDAGFPCPREAVRDHLRSSCPGCKESERCALRVVPEPIADPERVACAG